MCTVKSCIKQIYSHGDLHALQTSVAFVDILGLLDSQTMKQMKARRCGLPDVYPTKIHENLTGDGG